MFIPGIHVPLRGGLHVEAVVDGQLLPRLDRFKAPGSYIIYLEFYPISGVAKDFPG